MFPFTFTLSRSQAALRGALATVLGIIFIVWPGITIGTAVILFAIYCFMDAGVQLSRAFAEGHSGGERALGLAISVVDVVAAAVAIVWPGPTAGVLVVVVGIWAIFGGFAEISASFALSSAWLGVTGVLSIAAGVVLVAWPGLGAFSLAIILGAYLAAYGISLLVAAAMTSKGGRINPLTAGVWL